jgi:hypothetical protein
VYRHSDGRIDGPPFSRHPRLEAHGLRSSIWSGERTHRIQSSSVVLYSITPPDGDAGWKSVDAGENRLVAFFFRCSDNKPPMASPSRLSFVAIEETGVCERFELTSWFTTNYAEGR